MQLSKRLAAVLREERFRQGRPAADAFVVDGSRDPNNYRDRYFARVAKAAGIEATPKDLRDTFASQLLTAGIPLGYISSQLGHADAAVTGDMTGSWGTGV